MSRLYFLLQFIWGIHPRYQYLTGCHIRIRHYNVFTDKVHVEFRDWGRLNSREWMSREAYHQLARGYRDVTCY